MQKYVKAWTYQREKGIKHNILLQEKYNRVFFVLYNRVNREGFIFNITMSLDIKTSVPLFHTKTAKHANWMCAELKH